MIRGVGVYRNGQRDGVASDLLVQECAVAVPVLALAAQIERCVESVARDFVWIGMLNPSQSELDRLAEAVGMSELQVEDALNVRGRAKVEIAEDGVFAVCKVLVYRDATSDVETGQIAIFIKPGCVVSVRLGEVADLGQIRERLDSTSSEFIGYGPLAVMHAILDLVVDGYVHVAEEIGVDIAQIEEQVFSPDLTEDAQVVYQLKRENLEMRRAIDPLMPLAHRLSQNHIDALPRVLVPYYQDLADHLLRVADLIGSYDSLLSDILESSRSRLAVQQNHDMRKISAFVAMAAVPTAIAGIYGMNFDNIPELHWEHGYFVVLGFMATVVLGLYVAFKRSGWL